MKNIVNVSDFINAGRKALQTAVDKCSELGGGDVIVPKGKLLTGAVHLKSHIHIVLEDGAELVFSNQKEDYLPAVYVRWEGTECYNYSPLIYANECTDIAVIGNGELYGNGGYWWDWKKKQKAAAVALGDAAFNNIPVSERIYASEETALRPSFIQFMNCKDVLLEGFTIKDGPQWTIHPVYCENVVIKNVDVLTTGPNTDGLNPDSCRNVLIDGCTFSTGDDCIAINSGLNEDGWRVGIPCENVEVRNCVMNGGHGGVVIGSAISGGVDNIYIHDCKISGTMQGVRIKSMRGRGGYIHNVKFENIEVNNVTEQAIQINMYYEYSTIEPHTDKPTDVDNIVIRNILGRGAGLGIQIKGLPEYKMKNIILENIDLSADESMLCYDVDGIKINNVNIRGNK